MKSREKLYIVVYDIPETKPGRKRWRELYSMLFDFGIPVQKSVFECFLSPEHLKRLIDKIHKIIDETEDNVRIYSVSGSEAISLGTSTVDFDIRGEGAYVI